MPTKRIVRTRIHDRGSRVKELRDILRLTQRELAAMIGVSRVTIRAVENYQRNLSDEMCAEIAAATGCSLFWLSWGFSAGWAIKHSADFWRDAEALHRRKATGDEWAERLNKIEYSEPLGCDEEPLTYEKYRAWKTAMEGGPGEISPATEVNARRLCHLVHQGVYAAAKSHRHLVFMSAIQHALFETCKRLKTLNQFKKETIPPDVCPDNENRRPIIAAGNIGFMRSLWKAKSENRLDEWADNTLQNLDALKAAVCRIAGRDGSKGSATTDRTPPGGAAPGPVVSRRKKQAAVALAKPRSKSSARRLAVAV